MRAIILLLLVLGLAVLSGAATVLFAERVTQSDPSVMVGLPVAQADGGALVPVRLEPVPGGHKNRFVLRAGEAIAADQIVIPAGVTLNAMGADASGAASRFRITVASRSAAMQPSVIMVPVASVETGKAVRAWPEETSFSMLRDDFGIEGMDFERARLGLIAAAGAALGMLVLWLVAVIWMSTDAVRRNRAQATADRLAERSTDLERERDRLRQQGQTDSAGDKREAAFWREAVVGFLSNRNVDQAEIDRLLASIQVAIREKATPVDVEPDGDDTMPSLVAKRDWD